MRFIFSNTPFFPFLFMPKFVMFERNKPMYKAIYLTIQTYKMEISNLKQKPLWQMTGEEFLFLQSQNLEAQIETKEVPTLKTVYGIAGIAKLFNCSKPTASRIKKSKIIDKAITQIGRKIIVDADLALKLADRKKTDKK